MLNRLQTRTATVALAAVLAMGPAVATAAPEQELVKPEVERVGPGPDEAPAATGDYLTEGDFDDYKYGSFDPDGTDRDTLLAELKDYPIDDRAEAVTYASEMLIELDEEAEKLQEDIAQAPSGVEPALNGQWQELRFQRAEVQARFEALRAASASAWGQAKSGFATQFAILDRDLRQVAQTFRASRQDAPDMIEQPATGTGDASVQPEVRR